MDSSSTVVLLAFRLASRTEVDSCVRALLAIALLALCPKQVVPPTFVVLARKKATVHFLEDVGHVEGLWTRKVQAAAPSQRHLVEDPLVVREGALVGGARSEQRWRPRLSLHVDKGELASTRERWTNP